MDQTRNHLSEYVRLMLTPEMKRQAVTQLYWARRAKFRRNFKGHLQKRSEMAKQYQALQARCRELSRSGGLFGGGPRARDGGRGRGQACALVYKFCWGHFWCTNVWVPDPPPPPPPTPPSSTGLAQGGRRLPHWAAGKLGCRGGSGKGALVAGQSKRQVYTRVVTHHRGPKSGPEEVFFSKKCSVIYNSN